MIRKAVIPAAGFGTSFLPFTKAQPKEMLPIIDTPVIQYVVQECVDAGIEDILIISGKGKRAIEDHFDRNYELDARIQEKEDLFWATQLRHIEEMANIHFIRQKELHGLGDAIYHARYHCNGEPFAVLLGDTIIDGIIPAIQQLIDVYDQHHQTAIAIEQVCPEKRSKYGLIEGERLTPHIVSARHLIEKPTTVTNPDSWSIIGRYVLTPEIFKAIEQTEPDASGMIQLTDAFNVLLQQENIIGSSIEGHRYDISSKFDLLKTNVAFALKREEFAQPFEQYLREKINVPPRT